MSNVEALDHEQWRDTLLMLGAVTRDIKDLDEQIATLTAQRDELADILAGLNDEAKALQKLMGASKEAEHEAVRD